jgi:hypothetical protein
VLILWGILVLVAQYRNIPCEKSTITLCHLLGAGYTSDFVCDFMSDLLQIADAICCICDLVSHLELLPFTRSMQYSVTICCAICCAIWCAISSCERQTRMWNRTQNCRFIESHLRFGAKKMIGSDSCRTPNCRYTKLYMRFAANCTH